MWALAVGTPVVDVDEDDGATLRARLLSEVKVGAAVRDDARA